MTHASTFRWARTYVGAVIALASGCRVIAQGGSFTLDLPVLAGPNNKTRLRATKQDPPYGMGSIAFVEGPT